MWLSTCWCADMIGLRMGYHCKKICCLLKVICPLHLYSSSFSNVPWFLLGIHQPSGFTPCPMPCQRVVSSWSQWVAQGWTHGPPRANQSPSLGLCWSCRRRLTLFSCRGFSPGLWKPSCHMVERAQLRIELTEKKAELRDRVRQNPDDIIWGSVISSCALDSCF